MAKKRSHRVTTHDNEEEDYVPDITYLLTHDGTLTLSVDGQIEIISKLHTYYKVIKKSCLAGDLISAAKYANLVVKHGSWVRQQGLVLVDNTWRYNGEVVPSWLSSSVASLANKGTSLKYIEAAIEKQAATKAKTGDDVQLRQPLTEEHRAEIAYIGLAEFFRRNNQSVISTYDDAAHNIFYTLAGLRKYAMLVLFVTQSSRQLIAVEVPYELKDKTIDDVISFVHHNNSHVSKILERAVTQVEDSYEGTKTKKNRRLTLE